MTNCKRLGLLISMLYLYGVIRNALIADEDRTAANSINNFLQASGVPGTEIVESGEALLESCQRRPFDLVVTSWEFRGSQGVALFHRLRRLEGYPLVPFVALSRRIDKDDFRLLAEYPCSMLLEKPFTKPAFAGVVEALSRERLWNNENSGYLNDIFKDARQAPDRVRSRLKKLLTNAPNPKPMALLMARYLVENSFHKQAEILYKRILDYDDECLPALNGLGRLFYKTGRYDDATAFLRVAWRLSSKNIERLCLLGELDIAQHDVRSARQFFREALALDESSPKAQAGTVLCNNLEEHVRYHSKEVLPHSFASLCNTIGIALVRARRFERGIEQYKAALAFLPDPLIQARVMFNLGLGFLRWGEYREALEWVQNSVRLADPGFVKPKELEKKISALVSKEAGDVQIVGDDLTEAELQDSIITSADGVPLDPQSDAILASMEDDDSWFEEEGMFEAS